MRRNHNLDLGAHVKIVEVGVVKIHVDFFNLRRNVLYAHPRIHPADTFDVDTRLAEERVISSGKRDVLRTKIHRLVGTAIANQLSPFRVWVDSCECLMHRWRSYLSQDFRPSKELQGG